MPRFSVVIPLYNKAAYIQKTLDSVLAQEFTDFEVIVVDDGSTDNGGKIIKSVKDSRINYFYQENQGVSKARNKAIELASGEYLALLDADDLWNTHHLKIIDQLIIEHPKQKVFATGIRIQDQYGTQEAKYDLIDPDKKVIDFFKNSLAAPILSGSTTVLHASIPKEIGYFDETILSSEDTDYWIRIGLKYPVVFTLKPTATYTFVIDSLSNDKYNFKRQTDFSKFDKYLKNNKDLARYISYNRLSAYLNCMLVEDLENATLLKNKIEIKYLNRLQKITLYLPPFALRYLTLFKNKLNSIGFRPVIFKK